MWLAGCVFCLKMIWGCGWFGVFCLKMWLVGCAGTWGPHLIVVPTSVMLNWEMELKKWCPAFKILTYYGNQKERKLKRQVCSHFAAIWPVSWYQNHPPPSLPTTPKTPITTNKLKANTERKPYKSVLAWRKSVFIEEGVLFCFVLQLSWHWLRTIDGSAIVHSWCFIEASVQNVIVQVLLWRGKEMCVGGWG